MKLRLLLPFVLIATVLGVSFGLNPGASQAASLPPLQAGTPAAHGAIPGGPEGETGGLAQAIQKAAATQTDVQALTVGAIAIDHIELAQDGNHALVFLNEIDPETGEVIAREPSLVIARLTPGGGAKQAGADATPTPGSDWQLTFQADADWAGQLASLPADLLTDDMRQRFLSAGVEPKSVDGLTFGGYYLPWAGGQTKSLTWSVSHASCANNECRYAFDFADGTMFPLVAAKGGIVFDAVDKWSNGDSTHTNWLILQDNSTTPVSYQIYYHLAQNSIPAALKVKGTPVRQGQYIGNTDDTGYSSGHHLHFMVHTNPYGYWGSSVDITFRDVSINYDPVTQGGRPRLTREAATYGGQGQEKYTSGNFGSILPAGGLTAPADGTTVGGPTVRVTGSASDDLGITRMQVVANYGAGWVEIGASQPRIPAAKSTTLSTDVDLCAAGVPDGPISLGVKIWDVEGNEVSSAQTPRNVLKQYTCPGIQPPPPPVCKPSSTQVALYTASNFGGACQIYGVGDYQDSAAMGSLGGQGTASVQVGDKVSATLYSQAALKGRAESFTISDRNLADNLIGAYKAVSLRVQLRASAPAAPVLNAPGPLTDDDSVVLSWANGGGAVEFTPQLYKDGNSVAFAQRDFRPGVSWPVGSLPAGSYKFQVQGRVFDSLGYAFTGGSGTSNFTVTASPPVTAAPAGFPYEAAFEGGPAGWEARGDWGIRGVTDAQGQTTQAFVYNAAGTCAEGVRCAGSLTSPPIPIPASGPAALHFNSLSNTEPSGGIWDRRWVMYSYSSAPGGPYSRWLNLFELTGDPANAWLSGPDGWDLAQVNGGILAGKYVRLRFFYDSIDAFSNANTSWAIDNVRIDSTRQATANDANEPNNNSAAATPLSIGGALTGVIPPNGDLDYFKFSAVKGQVLLAEVSNDGSGLDPALALLDVDGTSLLVESAGPGPGGVGTARVSLVVPQNGVYFLRVKPRGFLSGSAGAGYRVTLTLLADTIRPTIQPVFPVGGELAPVQAIPLGAVVSDATGVSHVDFFYHLPDWINGRWVWIGSDWNGADGWGVSFSPPASGAITLWERAYDWADNTVDALSTTSWDIGYKISLPVVSTE